MDAIWGTWVEWAALVGAVVGFSVSLAQYKTAQDWKRAEFVASEVQKFFKDAQIAAALLLIDYNVIKLTPAGKRALKGQDGFVYNDEVLIRSLQLHEKFVDEVERFEPHEMLAREAFDALLTGLEGFDHHIRTGLIRPDDVRVHFRYWIPKLADPASGWKDKRFYEALWAFIRGYEYRGVERLLREFAVTANTQA